MALNVDGILESIITILKANTTTVALSLTSSDQINFIGIGDADNVPVEVTSYPAVLVNLVREIERFEQMGQRNNRHELIFYLWPLIYNTDNREASLKDMRKITQNVKSVLKSNITLSNTVLWSLPEEVDYEAFVKIGTFQTGSRITFRTHSLST